MSKSIFTSLRLDPIAHAVRKRITQRMLQFARVEVSTIIDQATEDLMITLQGTVYGKTVYEHSRHEYVPETWWDHFRNDKKWWPKVSWFDRPKWSKLIPWKLCHRLFGHPVMRIITVEHRHYRICPCHQKDLAGQEERFGGIDVVKFDPSHMLDFYDHEGRDDEREKLD